MYVCGGGREVKLEQGEWWEGYWNDWKKDHKNRLGERDAYTDIKEVNLQDLVSKVKDVRLEGESWNEWWSHHLLWGLSINEFSFPSVEFIVTL